MTDQFGEWRAEIATWPPTLRRLAERFPPWNFVRIVSTGAIGKVHGFSETTDGLLTLDVIVRQSWNPDLDWAPGSRDQLVIGLAVDDIDTIDTVH
jgi:hypothetical protein